MINQIYQLIAPRLISIKYQDISVCQGAIIRPRYMSICHADQRYFMGRREQKILKKKLPMALIHECCGEVLLDPTNTFKIGEKVVLIPNVAPQGNFFGFENYAKNAYFLSSGHDGFMRELVEISPRQLICFNEIDERVAALTEFVSVAVHAVRRFLASAHVQRNSIGIWGDGSLGYVVACVLKMMLPESSISIIGRNEDKLAQFSFVEHTYFSGALPEEFSVDHAFECCGGQGSSLAVDDMIATLQPQGTILLMGVSENKIELNSRVILEKGLSIIGCSRSGKTDFQKAIELMRQREFQNRLLAIVYEADAIRKLDDIYRTFAVDTHTRFKTVFRWEM